MSKQTKKAKKNDKRYAKASRESTLALATYDLAVQLGMSYEVRDSCYRVVSGTALRVSELYDKYYA